MMTTPSTTPAAFTLQSAFAPCGDQPAAIQALTTGVRQGLRDQVLLGVTGSGKTFTMAKVIADLGRPALILAHNKTLAGQLYGEMRRFFPDNAVGYFVSYYDYYQPEAYVPRTDTYIEKDSSINREIDRMRHQATSALLTRRDVILVASVSCIYGLGSPESYLAMAMPIQVGEELPMREAMRRLVEIQFQRNEIDFQRGTFRVRGETVEIFPADQESAAIRVHWCGETVERISRIDPLTGHRLQELPQTLLFPASHYVTSRTTLLSAMAGIKAELTERLAFFRAENRLLEAQRLEGRTLQDLEMIQELGYCTGIENYSRYLSGRAPGEPPPTLFEYLPDDAMLFVDESHVSLPQLRGMHRGDRSRKETLVEYGFRLPSALDNRPLTFEEWDRMRPTTIHVSATPAALELDWCGGRRVEQIIRPTGLLDPPCEVRPVASQVDDLLDEIRRTVASRYRVLVTTLTKRMAEDLTDYLADLGIKVRYLHSDIDTLERMEILRDLRLGTFEVLVGINLLREGLDLPEVALVAILDADKEGFLRSATSLVQTIGRAARNVDGRVILYADRITGSMAWALAETERRRGIQARYNEEHGIIPVSIQREVMDSWESVGERDYFTPAKSGPVAVEGMPARSARELAKQIKMLTKKMKTAAAKLDFEQAATLRDQLLLLESSALQV